MTQEALVALIIAVCNINNTQDKAAMQCAERIVNEAVDKKGKIKDLKIDED